ncbi:MAG: hypothetical protein R3246_13495, partial [Acidimicrobiia bacterium]|nr:hypothetical protein [Acidimicrobiia bacterium]
GASVLMERYPGGAGHFLATALVHLAPAHQVAVVGPDPDDLLTRVRSRYRPEVFLAVGRHDGVIPLLSDKPPIAGRATAYVCRGFVCDAPTTDPDELQAALPR